MLRVTLVVCHSYTVYLYIHTFNGYRRSVQPICLFIYLYLHDVHDA